MTASEPTHIPDLKREMLAAAERLYGSASHERPRATGGHRRPRRARRLAAVGVALTAATAAASIAFIAGAGSDPHADAIKATIAPDTLTKYFSVFRNAPDPIPAELAPFRLEPASAHRIATATSELWVGRRAQGQVCVLARRANGGFAGACSRLEQAALDGIFSDTTPAPADPGAGTAQVAALLPDGVSSVTLTLWNDTRTELPVKDNVLVGSLPARPRRARFVDANGHQHAIDLGDNTEGRAQPPTGTP